MLEKIALGTVLSLSLLGLQVGTRNASAATVDVAVQDFQFSPATINVTVGDTVRWTWEGSAPHDVQADDNSFDSGSPMKGGVFTRVFDSPGTYAYYCTVHGGQGGVAMSGVVNVQAASTATPTATTAAAATPTRTPVATATAEPSATALSTGTVVAPASTPVVVADPGEVVPITVPLGAGGEAAATGLPAAGTGRGGQRSVIDLASIALALTGASAVAAASATRRRR